MPDEAPIAIKDTDPAHTVIYNGITFGPLIKSEITGEAVYDDAGRAVKFVRHKLTIHGWIYAPNVDDQETQLDNIFNKLSEPSKRLVVRELGFDHVVDTAVITPDIDWGPKPKVFHWRTFGQICAEVVWQVEFAISRCNYDDPAAFRFSQFNYGTTYSIDSQGLTTRTIYGAYEVPGHIPTLTADYLWPKVVAAVPVGFRRSNIQRNLSMNKTRMEFSFTDTELPGEAFPSGIVDADGTYRFQNSSPVQTSQWFASLDMTLTVAPGRPASLAGQQFLIILASKLQLLRNASKEKNAGLVFRNFAVSHKLWTRTTSFSVQFMLTGCLHDLLGKTGVWSPMGTTYSTWATSMAVPWRNRGAAGLAVDYHDDSIVDVCVRYPTANIGRDQRISPAPMVTGTFSTQLLCPEVTSENSWLAYSNKVRALYEHQAVMHRFAQAYDPTSQSSSKYEDHVLQYQGAPDRLVLMQGQAFRLSFKPQPPKLLKVGGMEVDVLNANIEIPDAPAMTVGDCPVYYGRWAILYRVKGEPSSIKLEFKEGDTGRASTGCAGQGFSAAEKEAAKDIVKNRPPKANPEQQGTNFF